jgi:hypothetical protein
MKKIKNIEASKLLISSTEEINFKKLLSLKTDSEFSESDILK